jgi:protein-disulfide isomerase
MRRYIAVIAVALLAASAGAQTRKVAAKEPPPTAARAAAKPAEAEGLPTRATVESFLRHVFGWDSTLKWTVDAIDPSAATGIADIRLHVQTPKGEAEQHIYVTSDRKQAILGLMLPFSGAPGAKPSKEAIDAFVRDRVGANPAVTWSVGEIKPGALGNLTAVQVILTLPQGRAAQVFWVSTDGKHALLGDVSAFGADPYARTRAELAAGVNGPAEGPANAPITMVEFADLECPACKMAAPIVDRLLKEVPGTRLIFQQYPLTQIHKWAFKAAEFGECVAHENNDAFWKFLHLVYDHQEEISDLGVNTDQDVETKVAPKLTELATQAGVNGKETAACAARGEAARQVNASLALGKKMEITGTPTLFVNGRRINNVGGTPYDTLKKLVQFMGTPEAK